MDEIEIQRIDQLWQMHAPPERWATLLGQLETTLPSLPLREQLRLAPALDQIERAASSRKATSVVQLQAATAGRVAALSDRRGDVTVEAGSYAELIGPY